MMAKEPFGFVRRLQADHAGAGGWRTAVETFFPRATQPGGVGFADLRGITAPALMLAGDRDFLVPVEVATAAYRALPKGELAIIPGRDHALSKAGIAATIDFLQRH
jgi:pimeloyl-ACP methyl ester carboxylesterase